MPTIPNRLNQKPPIGTRLDYGSDLTAGLTAAYLLNEGAGSRVNDALGMTPGSIGSYIPAMWTGGLYGRAVNFDGNIRPIDLGATPATSFTGDFSMATLTRPHSTSGTQAIINKGSGNSASNSQYEWLVTGGFFRFDLFQGGANNTTVDPVAAVAEVWYHHVITRKGAIITIYRNGQSVASNSYPGAQNATSLHAAIGNTGSPGTNFPLNARVEHVFMWNRALTAGEIRRLYLQPYGMFRADTHYWVSVGVSANAALTVLPLTLGHPAPTPTGGANVALQPLALTLTPQQIVLLPRYRRTFAP